MSLISAGTELISGIIQRIWPNTEKVMDQKADAEIEARKKGWITPKMVFGYVLVFFIVLSAFELLIFDGPILPFSWKDLAELLPEFL